MSPDGKYFALAGDYKVRIWNNEGRQTGTFIDPRPYINPPNKYKFWSPNRIIYAASFLPDSRRLAVSVFPGTVHITDLSGRIEKTFRVKKNDPGTSSDKRSSITQIVFFPGGDRVLTVEPSGTEIILRDENFKMIKRINFAHGSWSITFPSVKISPDGKYFVVLHSPALPSKDGWNSSMKLYDSNGKFIRDIETDKPGRIKTPQGKFAGEMLKPADFHFTENSKHIVYMNGTYFTTKNDPLNRTAKNKFGRDKKLSIHYKIRKTAIPSGRQEEIWITDSNASIKGLYLRGDDLYGLGYENIYKIDSRGNIEETIPHENIEYKTKRGTRQRQFNSSNQVPNVESGLIFAGTNSPYTGTIVYDLKGNSKFILKQDRAFPKKIRVSHRGEFISLEIEKGKKSLLFDTNNNTVKAVNESVFFDSRNRLCSLKKEYSRERRTNIISLTRGGETETFTTKEHKLFYVIPLPDGKFADFKNGFTLFSAEGEAIKRYPEAKINQDTAIDPKLKFYINADTSSKMKTVQLFNLNGKRIKKWYLGAFFTAYTISPDGSLIAAGHNKTGYVQVWNLQGKLLKRFSDVHTGEVKSLAFTRDNRYLVSLEYDGTVKVTDLKENRRLKLTFLNEGKFMASDNSGRYDCSEGLEKRITVSEKGKIISGDRTDRLVYRFFQGE